MAASLVLHQREYSLKRSITPCVSGKRSSEEADCHMRPFLSKTREGRRESTACIWPKRGLKSDHVPLTCTRDARGVRGRITTRAFELVSCFNVQRFSLYPPKSRLSIPTFPTTMRKCKFQVELSIPRGHGSPDRANEADMLESVTQGAVPPLRHPTS